MESEASSETVNTTSEKPLISIQEGKLVLDPWLNGFKYRIPVNISNSGNALTSYQTYVTIDTSTLISAGKMRSDCGDTRFTDSDGVTISNYWIEAGCNTVNTTMWVKVPSIPGGNKTIFVYYGNPSATYNNTLGGESTFLLFDDFLGTSINTNIWTTVQPDSAHATVSQINNSLKLSALSAGQGEWDPASVYSKKNFTGSNAMRYRWNYTHTGIDGNVNWCNGFGSGGGQTDPNSAAACGDPNAYVARIFYFPDNSVSLNGYDCIARKSSANYTVIQAPRASSSFITFETKWSPARVEWEQAGVLNCSTTNISSIPTTSLVATLQIAKGAGSDSRDIFVDWVFVRNYTFPEPTATIGTEDALTTQAGTPTNWTWKVPSEGDLIRADTAKYWTWITYRAYTSSGLVGRWHFNEGNGTTAEDTSGNSNHGIFVNGTNWTGGVFGNAANFDGTDDYINISDSNSLDTTSVTVAFWFKLTTSPDCDANNNWRFLIRKGSAFTFPDQGWDVVLEENRQISFSIQNNTGGIQRFQFISVGISVGKWVFLAFSYNSSTGDMKVYSNGDLISSTTKPNGTIPANVHPVQIAKGNNMVSCPNESGNAPGAYDDVYLYGRTLSDDEVRGIYNGTIVVPKGSPTDWVWGPS